MLGKRAEMLVENIDAALKDIADALHRGQPPYAGKIVLVFVDEGAELKTPALFKIAFTGKGDKLLFRLPLSRSGTRASSNTSFAINLKEVRALLVKAEGLIIKRKEILMKIKHFKHWENLFCASNEKKVAETHLSAKDLMASIQKNLASRPTRAAKQEERERLGIEVEMMDGSGRPVAASKRDRPVARKKASTKAEVALNA